MKSADFSLPALPAAALGIAMVGCTVLWTFLSHWKSWGFESTWALDLGLYHSAVWNLAEGNGFTNTLFPHRGDGLFAQDHFEPILVLAALVFRAVPRIETLFCIQAGLLALGALGVARLLRQEGVTPWPAVAGGLIYLIWWPVWRLPMMDIRPVMWSVPFVLLAVVALRAGCVRGVLLWGLLACLCREELPIMLLTAAAAAWFWRGEGRPARRRSALFLAGLSLLYLGATWLLRSDPTLHIGSAWITLLSGGGTGEGSFLAVEVMPMRAAWAAHWALPVALGALAAPELLVICLPAAAFLLSTGIEWTQWNDSSTHYLAALLPGLVAASSVGWRRLLVRARQRWVWGARLGPALIVCLLSVQGFVVLQGWNSFVVPETWDGRSAAPDTLAIHALLAQLPREASVLTAGELVARAAGRRSIFTIEEETPRPTEAAPPLLPRAAVDPSWVLLPAGEKFWSQRARDSGLLLLKETPGLVLYGPSEAAEASAEKAETAAAEGGAPALGEKSAAAGHSRAPEMVAVAGGTYRLGESDPDLVARFREGTIAAQDWRLNPYCIARHPFPGPPHPWFPDGLVLGDLQQLERDLVPTGRRLCHQGELLLAAAGPENWRYPYHPSRRSAEACDRNDSSPQPFASFETCVSPLGVRDFMVRSSWTRAPASEGVAGGYVVVGGLMREDTVYASTNFGFHPHLMTDPRLFEDDGLRLCADPGEPSPQQDEAWAAFLSRAVDAGSFKGMMGGEE